MEVSRPNQAHLVDAPIASLFHVLLRWRRATDQHRWASVASRLTVTQGSSFLATLGWRVEPLRGSQMANDQRNVCERTRTFRG